MGNCDPIGYWTSTEGAGEYYFYATSNWVVSLSPFTPQAIRCVTDQ